MEAKPTNPAAPAPKTPEADAEYHSYVGHVIPWYVRLCWLGFWILFLWYVFRWLIPALKREMVSPP